MQRRDNNAGPRERFRAAKMAEVSRRYRPGLHFATTATLCSLAVAIAVHFLDGLTWQRSLAIVPMVLFLNCFEWFFHRYLMHRRKPWYDIFKRHTLEHHRLYHWRDMGIRERRELFYVLMPTSTIVAFVIVSSLLTLVVYAIFGAPYNWLFLAISGSYVLLYEMTHLAYHMPPGHWVMRSATVRRLAEHHSRHHDPKLMQQWNFNITLPFADHVFRTAAPRELVERIRAQREREDR